LETKHEDGWKIEEAEARPLHGRVFSKRRLFGSGMSTIASTLLITLKRRIWRITLDGAFYGDYRTERHAAESAEAAALLLRGEGRRVNIVMAQSGADAAVRSK
jgi:hypothetical protein